MTPSTACPLCGRLDGDRTGRRRRLDLRQHRDEFTRCGGEDREDCRESRQTGDKGEDGARPSSSQRNQCEFERLHKCSDQVLHGGRGIERQSDALLPPTPPCEELRLHASNQRSSSAAAAVDLSAPPRTKHEARNLAVSGPRRALDRGRRTVDYGSPDPSPGRWCSATRVKPSVMTSARIRLRLRAPMEAKRLFMSVPPRRCGCKKGIAPCRLGRSARTLGYKIVGDLGGVNPHDSRRISRTDDALLTQARSVALHAGIRRRSPCGVTDSPRQSPMSQASPAHPRVHGCANRSPHRAARRRRPR